MKSFPKTFHGKFPGRTLAPALLCLSALLIVACGGGKKTPGAPTGPAATPTLPPATATAVSQAIATAVAGLSSVPVISQSTAPGWQEEGEAGAKLTQVCPSPVQGQPFAEDASRLLRRTSGEQARSAAVIYLNISEASTYAQQLFGQASTCAQALARAWFGQTLALGSPAAGSGIGEESVSVQGTSGASSANVIFFRRAEGVAAVAVVGTDSAQLARQLATLQDNAIVQKLQSLRHVTPAP